MESSPDLPPANEYAGSADILPRPALLRNLVFWLLDMLLGSAFYMLLPTLIANNGNPKISDLLLVPALATILSMVALPILLPLLPWALTTPSVGLRWLRVFTLQSLSLGGLVMLGYKLAGGHEHGGFGGAAPLIGTIYFGAGLLAAVVVYWPWLRRPQ